MFKSILFTVVTALAVFNFAPSTMPANLDLDDQLVTLRAGTPVSLQLNEEISSSNLEIGNTVEFTVRTNVTVNGKVLIATGTIAEGYVKNVIKTCGNHKCKGVCAEIVITVESVQAVDGSRVYLNGKPHKMKGNCCCKGKAAIVNYGTTLRANVLNDAKIDA